VKLNEFFDHIYCVNLDRRTDRWDFVSNQFDRLGITVERISATDGNVCHFDQIPTVDHTKKRWFDLTDTAMTSNEAAILMTHVRILWDAAAKGYKNILIFEDDVVIRDDYEEEFDKAISELPEDWDLFYLGTLDMNKPWSPNEPFSSYLEVARDRIGGHAMAINAKAILNFIEIFYLGTLDMNKPWSPNEPFSNYLEVARDRIGGHAMAINSKAILNFIEMVNLKVMLPFDIIYSKRQNDFNSFEMRNNIAHQYGWNDSEKGKKPIEGIGVSDINDPVVFAKYLEDKYGKRE